MSSSAVPKLDDETAAFEVLALITSVIGPRASKPRLVRPARCLLRATEGNGICSFPLALARPLSAWAKDRLRRRSPELSGRQPSGPDEESGA